jgi:hypothetical protein
MAGVEFTPDKARDGIPLYRHQCARFGVAYLSEAPSPPGAAHQVPGCGCRHEHGPATDQA